MTDTLDSATVPPAPSRPDVLHVCVDTTPGPHPTDSDDIFWWLPVIGPTATVLAQVLARHTASGGTSWNVADLALRVGLSGSVARLWTTLNRLDQFKLIRFHATDVLTVRVALPALSERHLARLPADMVAAYRCRD